MPEVVGPEFERPIVELENKISELRGFGETEKIDFSSEIKILEERCENLKKEIFANLTPYQRVQLARHPKRPYTLDYIKFLMDDFIEIHGDRNFADDKSIISGFAKFNQISVMVVGHQKGRTTEENLERNFGMPHPEGYRKALRVMHLAGRFRKPIITFIDTPGAYPGTGAEERGQAEAIARNLREMSQLPIPVIVCVIGEGGSGGALAIGVGDRIIMLENAIYSVISPEGCAAILFRDQAKTQEAAASLKLTAQDLEKFGIIDEIIPEPLGGAHRDIETVAKNLGDSIKKHLNELMKIETNELLETRYQKYRKMGKFSDRPIRQEKVSSVLKKAKVRKGAS